VPALAIFLYLGRKHGKLAFNKNTIERLCRMRIPTLLMAAVTAFALAGCVSNNPSSPTNNAAVRTIGGAAAGAVIADATGGSKTKGALVGALVGGVSCGIPGLPACY
jgi:outer membrane lipoprotein SlyB